MNIFGSIISFIIMLTITFGIYVLCKKYIFKNVTINKWIPLSIAIVLVLAQVFIGIENPYISMPFSILPVIFFLWFMDIQQTGGPKNTAKKIVIKPKAKPNRVNKNK